MNDKTKEILDYVTKTAGVVTDYAGRAGKKIETAVDSAKAKVEIFEIENRMNEVYARLGRLVYTAHSTGEADTGAIDGVFAELDTLKKKLIDARSREEKAKTKIVCPICKKQLSYGTTECPVCGHKF